MITLGIPSRTVARVTKVEKYDFAVLTTTAVAGKKAGRNISFNKAAQVLLGLDKLADKKDIPTLVTFGSGPGGAVYIGNVSEVEGAVGLKVGKGTNRLQDKPSYDYLLKTKGLTEDVDNEFKLEDTGEVVEGVVLYAIVPLTVNELNSANTVEKVEQEEFEEATDENASISLGSVKEDIEEAKEETFEDTPSEEDFENDFLEDTQEEEASEEDDFDFNM